MLSIGEQLLTEFSMHNDVSSKAIETQISQLDLTFDSELVQKIDKIAICKAVDGVTLDQEQLALYASGKDSAIPTITKGETSTLHAPQENAKVLSRDTISRMEEGDLISEFQKSMNLNTAQ